MVRIVCPISHLPSPISFHLKQVYLIPMHFNLEFDIHHIWVGLSWRRGWDRVRQHGIVWLHRRGHLWICIIPCVMLHFCWSEGQKQPVVRYRFGTADRPPDKESESREQ